jgi:hypothetical protein
MTESPLSAGSDAMAAPLSSERYRVRIRVRRRRPRQGSRWYSRRWSRSRRRVLRTAFICAGILLVMGSGVYYSLAFMGSRPSNPRSVVAPPAGR